MWRGTEVPLLKKSFSFESAKNLKEHLGESKTLNISKWKFELITLRKEKDSLYSQIIDLRKEVEQAERVRPIKLDKNKI